jgi:mono/diheme cytochrome c family protein
MKVFSSVLIGLTVLVFVSCGESKVDSSLPKYAAKSLLEQVESVEKSNEVNKEILDKLPKHSGGMKVYNLNCKVCHQKNGLGYPNTFPPLAMSDFLEDKQATIKQVLNGASEKIVVNGKPYQGTMPSFNNLTDKEIADVLNFIYNNWGNIPMEVTSEEVLSLR